MDTLLGLRAGFLGVCFAGCVVLVWKHREAIAGLKQFFFEPAHPVNLGVLRAVVFGMLFVAALESNPEWFASLPESFKNVPRGWVWLADHYPFSPRGMRVLRLLLIVSTFFATIGLATREACTISALTAVFVFGVEGFYIKMNHGLHVPVLSALIIATSPAGDALSCDALIRRLRGGAGFAAHVAYTLPVRFCWLLVGTMYLFPGLWKLWEAGDLWIDGTKMRVELFDKWAHMPDYVPILDPEQIEPIAVALGVCTLVLELGFFFCVFNPKLRALAAVSAALFHLGVGLLMNIWFFAVHPLILLIDYPRLFPARALRALHRAEARIPARLRAPALPEPRAAGPSSHSAAASFVLGAILVSGMIVAGIGPIDSWPIAVYPRFADRSQRVRETSVALRFFRRTAGGTEQELPGTLAPLGETEVYRVVRAALEHKRVHQTFPPEHLALLTRLVRENHGPFSRGDTLLIYRYEFPVDPRLRRTWTPKLDLVAVAPLAQ